MKPFKISIIGAGTAGLASAIALGRLGCAVTVFEKHPSLATLGAGVLIQPQGVTALDQLGVGAAFRAASVPIERLVGHSHRGWRLVDIAYPHGEARAVSRTQLGRVLHEAAIATGAHIRFGAAVQGLRVHGGAAVLDVDGTEQACDMAIIANGATSDLPRQAGLAIEADRYPWGALWGLLDVADWPRHLLGQRYHGTRKMYGIMPTEIVGDRLRVSLFWSLHSAALGRWRATPLDEWKRELLDLWPESAPVVAQILQREQLTFATYHHARPTCLARPPVCIVGDAAHAMSPQLGLGSTLAVQDALALASHIAAAGGAQGMLGYDRARRRAVRRYQQFSALLTPCFQAEGNGLWRDAFFGAGVLLPGVRALMYRSIANPGAPARATEAPE